jgi:hypothetical protein
MTSAYFDRPGPADQILDFVAAFLPQKRGCSLLDAFRRDRQGQAAPEADHRANDGGRLRLVETGDECLIDLDLVERKRLR